jgi:hypothetical protein
VKMALGTGMKELVKAFFDLVKPQSSYSYAVLPGYIKGLTEQTHKTP